ncbi:hypothetical protein BC939DRAFT_18718 [Gamsiella multidivaricata]|uniref:uncharacterized protein n=1 Tax=Gamsiella multidivaricata TaxID=101098 RepID=UPI00221FD1EA|nr:uncharacterized protein BC939DRAFT_18718 [Gamsiella multidivaricata]KAI7817099.1 hypothetical protein BC939DRAFT_18718 [Gamsiella multidivaricata]
MLIYKNVRTIWRPISRRRFLVYDIPEVLAALGIIRDQLTVLDLVSHNDYNRNIYGLGRATDFSIIKELDGGDTMSMTTKYLADTRVVLKNTESQLNAGGTEGARGKMSSFFVCSPCSNVVAFSMTSLGPGLQLSRLVGRHIPLS